jgi:hypothetical protein
MGKCEILLSGRSDPPFPATLTYDATSDTESEFSKIACRILLSLPDRDIECHDRDYFEAFCRIRERLETVGIKPLCYGASRNVFPSGMGRDMGLGLRAYQLKLGCQPTMVDLVNIFERGPDVEPVTVEIQEEFFRTWVESIAE